MEIRHVRFAYGDFYTLGWLYVGDLKLATLEDGWKPDPDGPGGQADVSCVPDGTYVLRPHVSTKYPNGVWALENHALGVFYQKAEIPQGARYGRFAVLIHQGNHVRDVAGCMLVGLRHHYTVEPTVQDSAEAMRQLRIFLKSDTHRLTISPTRGTNEVAP
jgi:hypothetical protein